MFAIFISLVWKIIFFVRILYVNIWEENILIVQYKQWPIGLFSLIHSDSSHKDFHGTKPSEPFLKLDNKTLYTYWFIVEW